MTDPFSKAGGRKFFLVLLVYLGSGVLLWWGKLTSESYASILEWSVAAYITGNVAQRHVESKGARNGGG